MLVTWLTSHGTGYRSAFRRMFSFEIRSSFALGAAETKRERKRALADMFVNIERLIANRSTNKRTTRETPECSRLELAILTSARLFNTLQSTGPFGPRGIAHFQLKSPGIVGVSCAQIVPRTWSAFVGAGAAAIDRNVYVYLYHHHHHRHRRHSHHH